MAFILNPEIIAGDLAKGNYSAEDLALIEAEKTRLYAALTAGKQPGAHKTFYITSGGPGSGKTTLIRKAQQGGGTLARAVHVDPDEIIKSFAPYADAIAAQGDSDAARAQAYDRWRWASVYMANTIVNQLAADGYDIVLGTTGTSPSVRFIYQAAHDAGYASALIMCHAPESVRLDSGARRFEIERRFTPEADVREKGNKLFPEIVTTHFTQAQSIFLLWRPGTEKEPVLAAEAVQGVFTCRDPEALAGFINELHAFKPELNWNDTLAGYTQRFAKPGKTVSPAP